MAIFEGVCTALVTPMKANGEVNFEKLDELIEMQIAGGVDALCICGTTGEASTLSHEEHIEVIAHGVKTVNKRVPVIAGAGSNSTETAIYLSVEAEKAGADAVLHVSPYYNKASQKGLIKHFTAVANAIKIPVILYNVPSRTGCNIKPETQAELINNVPNIVGVKEASGDISAIAQVRKLIGDNGTIYSGNDDQAVSIMSLGGKGLISVLSNVAPEFTHEMVCSYLEGDVQKSRDMQIQSLDLIDALFCEVNPIPVKTALNLMGLNAGPLRLPLCEMEEANEARLKKALIDFGIKCE
ncbi:MAG: 4-hydroxy-tetrahydrodipicolinate synthase [Lachnospiraceae bacterium]|nr:4-hydroxy-tetrahydrodipicolinate synthase [Lachnospiraceae bacterium]MDY6221085.1 4-hydroxy-tetrahydrodipicolinate synthase [Candidatus Alectryocaccobium sp.]